MRKNSFLEIEIKFPLQNPKELEACLNKKAKKIYSVHQIDDYYIPQHRNFLKAVPVNEWLRIRKTSKGFSLDYKRYHNTKDKKSPICDEFETKIVNIQALKKILLALDFKKIVRVDKKRTVWDYCQTHIALDEVKGLGFYIEIESKGNFKTTKLAEINLNSVLKKLNAKTESQDFNGYPYLLLEKKGLIEND